MYSTSDYGLVKSEYCSKINVGVIVRDSYVAVVRSLLL